MTQHAKNCKNRPQGRPGIAVKYEGQMRLFPYFFDFFIFIFFLPAPGDHIFARIDTVFASDDVFRWGLIS